MSRDETLARFASLPDRLAAAAATAGPVPDGEWGPSEIVRHLIAVERQVWHLRLASLETDPSPRWSPQEPGLDEDSAGLSLDAVLATFADSRRRTMATLTALDDLGWARAGDHDVYGHLDVEGLLRVAIEHDEEHLASLDPDA